MEIQTINLIFEGYCDTPIKLRFGVANGGFAVTVYVNNSARYTARRPVFVDDLETVADNLADDLEELAPPEVVAEDLLRILQLVYGEA